MLNPFATPRSRALLGAAAMGLILILCSAYFLRRYEIVLRVRDEVPIEIREPLAVKTHIDQQLDVTIPDHARAVVSLGPMEIPIDETLEVPLALSLQVPIDSEVKVDQPIAVRATIPVHYVLTEKELDLSNLVVPIDSRVLIDDVIEVNTTIPIDTTVQTTMGVVVPVKGSIPVRTQVPIRQRLRVKDRIAVKPDRVSIPLNLQLPIDATIPFKQVLRVRGVIDVPVTQRVRVPVRHVLHPELVEPIAVRVVFDDALSAGISAELNTTVDIPRPIPLLIGDLPLRPREFHLRAAE